MREQIQTLTMFQASAVPEQELNGILAEYLALEHLRVFRRLLAVRVAVAIVPIVIAGTGFSWRPRWVWLACVGIVSVTPVWVWLAERRRERHLTRRLQGVSGARTQVVASAATTRPDGPQEPLHRG